MFSPSFADANSLGAGGPKPNFALNFITETLDPRVTFSRTSHATRFNSSGVLEWAPNNMIRNNTMQGAVAGTPGTVPTNWNIDLSSVSGISREIVGTGTENGITYIDIRLFGTSAVTANALILFDTNNAAAASPSQAWAVSSYVKLQAGSLTGIASTFLEIYEYSSVPTYLRNTSAGTFTPTTAGLSTQRVSGTVTTGASTAFTRGSVTVRFTSGVAADITLRIGLPQLELGSTARTAVQTSGTAYYGHRTDYDPSNVVRQNLLTYSEQFDHPAWGKTRSLIQTNQIRNNTMQGAVAGTPGTGPTNWAIGGNGGLSREIVGTGLENGINYIDIRFFGTVANVANPEMLVVFETTTGVPALSGQTWTSSFYAKIIAGTLTGFLPGQSGENFIVAFNSSGGLTEAQSLIFNYTLTNTNLSDNRYTKTFTLSNASTAYIYSRVDINLVANASCDFTIRIGMPQLVRGSVPGDIVATSGTALPVQYLSPFGTLAAEKLIEDTTASNTHLVNETITFDKLTTYTVSAFLKQGERTWAVVQYFDGVTVWYGYFNLANGTAGITNSSVRVENFGNGWYRCSVTATSSSTAGSGNYAITSATGSGTNSYTGDGSSGIYIFGAQLNRGNTALQYYPTTTAAYTECQLRGLLIEEARTNSIRNSTMQGGSAGVAPTNFSITAGAAGITSSVIGVGIEDGIPYVDVRWSGTPANYSYSCIFFEPINQVTALPNSIWTLSAYVRLVGGNYNNITKVIAVMYNADTSGIGLNQYATSPNYFPSSAPLNSQRYSVTSTSSTFTNSSTAYVRPYFQVESNANLPIDITLRFGLPQLELLPAAATSLTASSPIPTYGSTYQRLQDLATVGLSSSWYNFNEGTLLCESIQLGGVGDFALAVRDNTGTDYMGLGYINSAGGLSGSCYIRKSGVSQGDTGINKTANLIYRDAMLYSASVFKGATSGTLTAGLVPTNGVPTGVTTLQLGWSFSGTSTGGASWFRKFQNYPRALSDSELKTITS